MYLIPGLTDDFKQQQTMILPNGEEATLYLEYKPNQYGWFMSIAYNTFTVNLMRVTTNQNILHQYINLLPFGIACFTNADQEPTTQEDFLSGRSRLYLLDSTETKQLLEFYESNG